MFSKKELVGYFKNPNSENPKRPNDHFRRTCDIARIVTACRYFDNGEVRERLNNTLVALEDVLYV